MEFKPLKLDVIEFTAPPTKTQVVNLLQDMEKFLQRVGGALLCDGSYKSSDQAVGAMLNGAAHLAAAATLFEQAPSQAGLVHAMPAPPAGPPGPRRA